MRIGARLTCEARGRCGHRRTIRVKHLQLDVAGRRHGRFDRVLEIAADELDADFVAGAIQRAIGKGVQLGVVDLAVVIEILGDEHAARAVAADHVAAFGRHVAQVGRAVGLGGAGSEHAYAVGPVHRCTADRLAALALGRPHHHPLRSALGDGHGVRHKQQRVRTVRANHGFNDVQTGGQLANRDHHVAGVLRHPFAAAALELHVLGRCDGLGVPDRVAEAAQQFVALERRVLRVVREARGRGHLVAHAELRRGLHGLAARGERQHTLPGAAGLARPVVPQIGERVGQAFTRVVGLDVDAVQVLLRLQKFQRLRHAVDEDVRAAVAGQFVLVLAARRFKADHRFLISPVARIREQEERLPLERLVAAARHVEQRWVRRFLRIGRVRCRHRSDQRQHRHADGGNEIERQPTVAHEFFYRVKKARRNTPMKLGLPLCGCQRESFHCISSETGTARRPLSVRVTVPVW